MSVNPLEPASMPDSSKSIADALGIIAKVESVVVNVPDKVAVVAELTDTCGVVPDKVIFALDDIGPLSVKGISSLLSVRIEAPDDDSVPEL